MATSVDFTKDEEFQGRDVTEMSFSDIVDIINAIVKRETKSLGGYKEMNESEVINYTIKTAVRQATQREKNKATQKAVKALLKQHPELLAKALAGGDDDDENDGDDE